MKRIISFFLSLLFIFMPIMPVFAEDGEVIPVESNIDIDKGSDEEKQQGENEDSTIPIITKFEIETKKIDDSEEKELPVFYLLVPAESKYEDVKWPKTVKGYLNNSTDVSNLNVLKWTTTKDHFNDEFEKENMVIYVPVFDKTEYSIADNVHLPYGVVELQPTLVDNEEEMNTQSSEDEILNQDETKEVENSETSENIDDQNKDNSTKPQDPVETTEQQTNENDEKIQIHIITGFEVEFDKETSEQLPLFDFVVPESALYDDISFPKTIKGFVDTDTKASNIPVIEWQVIENSGRNIPEGYYTCIPVLDGDQYYPLENILVPFGIIKFIADEKDENTEESGVQPEDSTEVPVEQPIEQPVEQTENSEEPEQPEVPVNENKEEENKDPNLSVITGYYISNEGRFDADYDANGDQNAVQFILEKGSSIPGTIYVLLDDSKEATTISVTWTENAKTDRDIPKGWTYYEASFDSTKYALGKDIESAYGFIIPKHVDAEEKEEKDDKPVSGTKATTTVTKGRDNTNQDTYWRIIKRRKSSGANWEAGHAPYHYIDDGSTRRVMYCLQYKKVGPTSGTYYQTEITSINGHNISGITTAIIDGLVAIMQNGHPFNNANMPPIIARQATQYAIRIWMRINGVGEETGDSGYDTHNAAFTLGFTSNSNGGTTVDNSSDVDPPPSHVSYTPGSSSIISVLTQFTEAELAARLISNSIKLGTHNSSNPITGGTTSYTIDGKTATRTGAANYMAHMLYAALHGQKFTPSISGTNVTLTWDATNQRFKGTSTITSNCQNGWETSAAPSGFTFTPGTNKVDILATATKAGSTITVNLSSSDTRAMANFYGFYSGNSNYQTGVGIAVSPTAVPVTGSFTVTVPAIPNGTLSITKKSGNTSITNGNSNYSLQGAVYTVYTAASGGTSKGTITTNASGSGTLSLAPGTYYLEETTAPAGYVRNTTRQSFTIQGGLTTSVTTGIMVDTPIVGSLKITKSSANTSITNNNSNYSLSGAVYELKSGSTVIATLTTNASGVATASNIPLGTYTLTEKTASTGYTRNTGSYSVSITNATQVVLTASTASVLSETPIVGSLKITKSSANTTITNNNSNYSLQGAVYELKSGSTVVKTLTTNASGVATATNIPLGSYTLTEKTASPGYIASSGSYTVEITNATQVVLTSSNTAVLKETPITGSVKITKTSANTSITNGNSNYSVVGAVYELKSGSTVVGTLTTGTNGVSNTVSGLPLGSYTLTEKTASAGYTASSGSYTVTLTESSKDKSLTASDSAILSETPIVGSLKITKSSSNTSITSGNSNYSLQGAVYELKSGSTVIKTLTTNSSGVATATDIPLGTYTLTEKTASTGYTRNTGSYTVKITGSTQVVLTASTASVLSETPITGTLTITKSATPTYYGTVTNSYYSLAGAVYELKSGSTVVKTLTTDANGTATATGIPLGSYTLTEKTASQGYTLNTDSVTVEFTTSSLTKNLTASNASVLSETPQTGSVTIVKSSNNSTLTNGNSNYSLAGAIYELKQGSTLIGTFTTLADGTANTLSNLAFGDYTLTEKTASPGYTKRTGSYTVSVTSTGLVTVTGTDTNILKEVPITGSITIVKSSGNPALTENNSNYSLAGAVYQLKQGNTVKGTFTTLADGTANTITGLALGDYTLVETTAPQGFGLNSGSYTVSITDSNLITLTSTDTDILIDYPNVGSVTIVKSSANTAITNGNTYYSLAGAQYELKQGSTLIGTFTTLANGTANTLNNIPFGTYTLTEKTAPNGYQLNSGSYTVEVTSANLITITATDTTILKDTPITGSLGITKVSANTTITNGNNNYSLAGAVYELSQNGVVKYTLTTDANGISNLVTGIPFGEYVLTEKTASPGYNKNSGSYTVTFTSSNYNILLNSNNTAILSESPITGSLKIIKTSADESITDGNNNYSLVGAIYELRQNGVTKYTLTIQDEQGNSNTITGIPLGSYTLVETTAPQGYTIASGEYAVSFTASNNNIVLDADDTSILDEVPITGSIKIQKVSSDPSITNGNEHYSLAGAVYQLKQGNTVVGTFTTIADGSSNTITGLALGDYTLTELTPPPGFEANTGSYTVSVTTGNLITITVNDTTILSDAPLKGSVTIVKVSGNPTITDGNSNYSLAGAQYQIKQGNTVKGTFTTLADGTANTINNLPFGTYTLIETVAPQGYDLNTDEYEFQITNSTLLTLTSAQTDILADQPVAGSVTIVKSSANTTITNGNSNYSLAGAVYELKQNGVVKGTFTIKADGTSNTVRGLAFGDYVLTEKTAPTGYAKNNGSYTVHVTDTNTITITATQTSILSDTPLTGSVTIIKSSSNPSATDNNANYSLAGAVYELKQNGVVKGTFTTLADGTANTVSGLPFGDYVLTEKTAPTGFVKSNASYTVHVTNTNLVTVTATDTEILNDVPQTGSVTIIKVSGNSAITNGNSNYSLAGAVYELKQNGIVKGTFTTNADGTANTVSGLIFGDYVLTEKTAPTGYNKNTGSYTVSITSTGLVTITSSDTGILSDTPQTGSVTIIKTSSNPATSGNVNYSLAGAQYELKQGNTLIGTFVTNSDGTANTITGLAFGSYTLTEKTAPTGYNKNTGSYTVEVTSTGLVTLTASDTNILSDTPKTGAVTIIKSSSSLETYNNSYYSLAGAQYELKQGNTLIGTFTTDANGLANTITGLLFGDYTLTETVAPTGYNINNGSYTVHVTSTGVITLSASDTELLSDDPLTGEVSIVKSSANTTVTNGNNNYSLAGAVYQVKKNGTVVGTLTTNSNGSAGPLSGLYFGEYTIEEITAPQGYYKNNGTYTFTVSNTTPITLTVSQTGILADSPILGSIKIKKNSASPFITDGNSNYSLAGAVYKLVGNGKTYTFPATDTAGEAILNNLPLGTYTLSEVSASTGYTVSSGTYSVTISNDTQISLTSSNTSILSEVPKTGMVTIQKRSADTSITNNNSCYSLANAEYKLYKADGTFIETLITDTNGNATSTTPLPIGNYYIEESKSSTGYYISTGTMNFTITDAIASSGQPLVLNGGILNEVPITDTISAFIYKVDAETGTADPQGDASLEGAQFTVKYYNAYYTTAPASNVAPVYTWVFETDDNAYIEFAESYKVSGPALPTNQNGDACLPLGTIVITETLAPEGYMINNTVYVRKIETNSNNELIEYSAITVSDQVIKGKFTIEKREMNTFNGAISVATAQASSIVEPNAVFQIIDSNNNVVDTLTTGGNGRDTTIDLPYGTYTIHQISGKTGLIFAQDRAVTISTNNENQLYTIYNDSKNASLHVIKKDAETNTVIAEAGVTFQILDNNDQVLTIGGQSTFTTNSNGEFTTAAELPYGTYKLVETIAPEGYALPTTPITFVVNDDSFGTTGIVEVIAYDSKASCEIDLYKTGLVSTGLTSTTENGITVTKPVFEQGYLVGVVFSLYAKTDILNNNGTVKYAAGTHIADATTESDGHAHFRGLQSGTYEVRETSTLNGYILVTTPIEVVCDLGTSQSIVVVTPDPINNQLKDVFISFLKQKEVFTVANGSGSYSYQAGNGFTFGLYAAEDLTIIGSGTTYTIPAGTLLSTAISDAGGNINFTGYYPAGNYYVKELAVVDNSYILDNTQYPVTITMTNTAPQTIIIDNTSTPINNNLYKAAIRIIKKDAETGNIISIAGATFEIRNSNDVLVDTISTDSTGYAETHVNLPYGTYSITETRPPEGYELDSTAHTIVINNTTVQTDAGVEYVEYEAKDTKLRYEIVAYKSLVGKQLESGMFTFELIKYGTPINANDPFSGNVTVIDSTSNSTVITDINDPHYGMSSINFIIPIDEDGIYYYGIREIAGSDNTMVYDTVVSHITINVVENADGTMSISSNYDKTVFENRMADTMLPIMKTVVNNLSNDAVFNFKVELYEGGTSENPNPLTETYTVLYSDGRTATIQHNGTISLKGNESCIIRGLPYMTKYTVTEIPTTGYELTSSSNTTGTSQLIDNLAANEYSFNESYAVKFTNEYHTSGQATLAATKQLIGKAIEENTYAFELKDSSNTVIQTVYAQTNGSIEFIPISYTAADNGQVYTYTISEVPGNDTNMCYDPSVIIVTVSVNDNGAGTMVADVSYSKEPIFVNNVLLPLTVTNKVVGIYNNEEFIYTLKIFNNEMESITYKFNNGEEQEATLGEDGIFTFTLKDNEKIDIYGIYSGTELEVTQDPMTNFSTTVNNISSYTYHIDSLSQHEYINYINSNLINIPNTGSNTAMIMIIIGNILLLIGIVFITIKNKKIIKIKN